MKIEIWSDVMCPFCYIGKRNLEKALANFDKKDQLEIEWKSYQLDPTIPENVNDTYVGYLSKKRNVSVEQGKDMLSQVIEMAKAAGLEYHFEKAIMTSSHKAHCLIQFAKTKGKGDEMEERLFLAFFTEGKNVSDILTLESLATEVGLDDSEVKNIWNDDAYSYLVKQDINEAMNIGVTGVPFFVFDRKYAISGAQPVEAFSQTINKAFGEWEAINKTTSLDIINGASCTIDGKCE